MLHFIYKVLSRAYSPIEIKGRSIVYGIRESIRPP